MISLAGVPPTKFLYGKTEMQKRALGFSKHVLLTKTLSYLSRNIIDLELLCLASS